MVSFVSEFHKSSKFKEIMISFFQFNLNKISLLIFKITI